MGAPTDVLIRIDEIEGELAASPPRCTSSGRSSPGWQRTVRASRRPRLRPRRADPRPALARRARHPASLERGSRRSAVHLSEGAGAQPSTSSSARSSSRAPTPALRGSSRSSRVSHAISRPCGRPPRARRAARSPRRRRAGTRPERGVRDAAECAARAPGARPACRSCRRAVDPAEAGPAAPHGRAARADWDLLGPRGFAIIGGAVTAFGIILLFVLAANRGWITPAMRVAFGACVSAAAVGVAFWVRSRYGQLQMSLGAAGAGIAGGYATLAAAAARYDLVPDWLALPLAGGLAALAVVIAIAWSSETVAAIGLLGAALAPALQAIDTGLSWPSVAFAVIILGATVALAVPRRWHKLLIGIGVVVGAQVALLALDADASAGAGTTAVVASFVLVVLAAGIWLQLVSGKTDLDPLASSFVLAAVGLALLLVRPLWDVDRNQGIALAGAAVVWAGAWIALRRVQPALALVLGVSSLSLAAVATADLLSGTSLALTWSAEALLLSFVALRMRDARLQATALVYCAITAAHVLLVDAPPRLVFERARRRHRRGLRRRARTRPARCRPPRACRGRGAHRDRAARLARSRPGLARGASRRAAGGPRPRRRRSRHLRRRDPAHRALVPPRPPRGHDRRRSRRCRRRRALGAARLRGARRGVACLGRRRVRHRLGLRCARVRGRGDPPLLRRLGADRRLGRRARCLLRLPAPLPRRAPHRRAGRRRRRSRSPARPPASPSSRRPAMCSSRPGSAGGCSCRPSSSSASRRACSAFPAIAISRRSCGRSVQSRSSAASGSSCATRRGAPSPTRSPRPSSACSPGRCASSGSGSPAGSSRSGRHSSPSSRSPGSGPSTAPSRCATRSPASRPRPPSLVVCALAWGDKARRDLVTVAWATAILPLILAEAFLVGGGPATAFVVALTGALSPC